jgi:hypothetical protein
MAATATSFGNGVWGLSAEQVGMVLETLRKSKIGQATQLAVQNTTKKQRFPLKENYLVPPNSPELWHPVSF